MQAAIDTLLRGDPLPPKKRDHALTGNLRACRECHIAPDWVFLYRIEKNLLVLVAMRTGTHEEVLGG